MDPRCCFVSGQSVNQPVLSLSVCFLFSCHLCSAKESRRITGKNHSPKKHTKGLSGCKKCDRWATVLMAYIVPAECDTTATCFTPKYFRTTGTTSNHVDTLLSTGTAVEPPKPGLCPHNTSVQEISVSSLCLAHRSKEPCQNHEKKWKTGCSLPINNHHSNSHLLRQMLKSIDQISCCTHRVTEQYHRQICISKIRRCGKGHA